MAESMDPLTLYQAASEYLEIAAMESQKQANVDIGLMQTNISLAHDLICQIHSVETDPLIIGALNQLSTVLLYQQETLLIKIRQLDRQAGSSSSNDSMELIGVQKNDQGDMQKKARRQAIEETIALKGQFCFNDVAGLEEAKQALREAIIMPVQFPQLFTGGRKPWQRILLYGPPGTGKSRLAQAVSSEIRSNFYSVSSSDLISSWVGESEKLIKELFQHATSQEGRSVVFIDEIDSVCRKRSSHEEEHTRRVKTELLKQMEGADSSGSSDRIFLLCATNCPWELDPAFLRRFQKRIYIPLPDVEARHALMRLHCQGNDVQLSDEDWLLLAQKTEGFSGSDLATLVNAALFEPVRDLQGTDSWIQTPDGLFIPCHGDNPLSITANINELPPERVQVRGVCVQDFLKSLVSNRKTVMQEELIRFAQFTNSFGQHG
ncbi:vacuolar protein sorting-associated protein 4B-like [Lingula anatina]|uniref:Vacuolar protein sorting-associated protein 4B-like n=1 Tax=Lingula anatina TaxID=7574 RepID=A0A1S3HMZ0_LINAN|nr:vacuolar protein sorting-associated protein 4B-like [Lingula anatina]|eukprot:XP_013386414.1 vacuolar protein sorting-associated protein 4B-like [Lingula anatina]